MLHKRTENRRWRNHQKAVRKQNISRHVYGFEWYECLGKYDKGKVHCSCPYCTAKTNDKFYGSNNYKASDRRKIEATNAELREF